MLGQLNKVPVMFAFQFLFRSAPPDRVDIVPLMRQNLLLRVALSLVHARRLLVRHLNAVVVIALHDRMADVRALYSITSHGRRLA